MYRRSTWLSQMPPTRCPPVPIPSFVAGPATSFRQRSDRWIGRTQSLSDRNHDGSGRCGPFDPIGTVPITDSQLIWSVDLTVGTCRHSY